MYQYTTPTITITFPNDIEVREIREFILTLQQGDIVIEKNMNDVTMNPREHTISCTLTQEETGQYSAGVLLVQAHFKIASVVYATNIMRANVLDNLHKEVI